MVAYAPLCPISREERWYAILADAPNNAVLSWGPVNLLEAECSGIEASKRDRKAKLEKVALEENGKSEKTEQGMNN